MTARRLHCYFLVLVALSVASAVRPCQAADKIACEQYRDKNQTYKRPLWDGYGMVLGPNTDPEAVEDKCAAAIYSRDGEEVFRTSGFSVRLDEDDTGEDFDNDGKPEVVFETDSGGGMHCCWAYEVVSLRPKPHRLFEIDAPASFEKDKDGKMLIWERRHGTMNYTSMARTPYAERVFRVRDRRLVDVTPEFCAKILAPGNEDFDGDSRALAPELIQRLQLESPGWDREETVSAILSRALQHVFCRQYQQAINYLNQWPESGRAKMKADFGDAIKEDFPDFAAQLTKASTTK